MHGQSTNGLANNLESSPVNEPEMLAEDTVKPASPEPTTGFDLVRDIPRFLPDGEVAIFIEAGFVRYQYAFGLAIAINSQGRHRVVSTGDIMSLATGLTESTNGINAPEYLRAATEENNEQ
jgi:hypothetical protein